MKLSTELKIIIGLVVSCVILIAIGTALLTKSSQTLDRSSLLPADTAIKGSADAKVYLVEFSDFQCPACKSYQPVIDQLMEKYKDRVVFGYRHFPLPQHLYAIKAAEAAEAAGEQGKFWEMYKYLFDNQTALNDQLILESGKPVGLDEQQYQQSLNSGKFKDKVTRDLTDGKNLGVNSTPTFFLNGQKLNLNSFADLERAIEREIGQD